MLFDRARALDEHAARAAGRVEYGAALGVEHMGDERDQGDGREEFAVVVGLLVGELGQKIFVDPAKDIAGHLLQFVRVEEAQDISEGGVAQLLILVLGQDTAQVVVVRLNGVHCVHDGLGAVRAVGQSHEVIELGFRVQEDGAPLGEVFLGERPPLAASARQGGFNLPLGREIAAVGVTQEDQPHHGQEVFIAGVLGVGPQGVGSAPKPAFDGLDMFELEHIRRLQRVL